MSLFSGDPPFNDGRTTQEGRALSRKDLDVAKDTTCSHMTKFQCYEKQRWFKEKYIHTYIYIHMGIGVLHTVSVSVLCSDMHVVYLLGYKGQQFLQNSAHLLQLACDSPLLDLQDTIRKLRLRRWIPPE